MAYVDPGRERPPSRAVSLTVSAALVVFWGYVRLFAFETTVFPLAYSIPLLVHVWTRDRLALWSMAAIFLVFHAVKLLWLIPPGLFSEAELWANYGATFSNVLIAGVAVHLIINLRTRLEDALHDVREQAEELRVQGEEMAQQNEELAEQTEELSRQTEELSQQGEELASQNEELQAQSEEIATLNTALERREALLQTLLETARLSGSEHAALQHIAMAALDLFRPDAARVAVYEQTSEGLRVRALAAGRETLEFDGNAGAPDAFVSLVLREGRTACLNDAALRPDLTLSALPGQAPPRAALCAPVRFADRNFGAFAIYSAAPHAWTDEQFRVADWLADQCGRVLQALRVQSDLREADRRKSEFLATLSHELRNPLAPIGFALKLIEKGEKDSHQAMGVMRRQLRQLVRLVDDLLDATRLASNKVQIRAARVDLVPIVEHALEAARPEIESARHTLVPVLPAAAVWVDADPERMSQVVSNLLSNAARYTPPGGRITLGVTIVGAEAVLSVADTGVGLEAADLDRVFEMFTQVGGPGSGGLGIGLALVRGIVELHGGRVEARSEGHGRGSEFRVVLPLAAVPSQEARLPEPAAVAGPARARVLVVDDNLDSAEMMAALLEHHGHTVRVAHDAAAALAAAFDFSPDAALLDIGLPHLNGYELARRLRDDARTRNVRLIAVTGWATDSDRARARDAGFDGHLTKPVEPHVVLAALGPGEVSSS